jgi:hypothetical protein
MTSKQLNKFSIIFALLFLQHIAFSQFKVDSTLLKNAVTTINCVENIKKLNKKELYLKCTIVGSQEMTLEKDKLYYLLEADDAFPDTRVCILIAESDADQAEFSRYFYHQKKVLIKGKLVKNKGFRDRFGNPRLVIFVKDLNQIMVL